ncbi:hypothetical protein FG478_00240, partial [Xylella fastidiosa subsp. multiplex]|nr:hypothetical protein [Xylella fastidiosa subsp. multiplex]
MIPGAAYSRYSVFVPLAPVWTSEPVWVPRWLTSEEDATVLPSRLNITGGLAPGSTNMQYAP